MKEKRFKGGKFLNRYKLTGKLTTISPLHIGDGEMMSDPNRVPAPPGGVEVPKFTTVMTDARGRAYIPGTTLKGNLRNWLTQVFTDFGLAHINDPARANELRDKMEDHKNEKEKLHEILKKTEHLFGSSINEGKLEIWDAPMSQPPKRLQHHGNPNDSVVYSGYDAGRGTIVLKSVAINPVTGTAAKRKLYNYEAVPKGATFNLTIAGQNLLDEELGMLLFALEGFRSQIYPITLGSMGGAGFGRFNFEMKKMYYLNKDNFHDWIEDAIRNGHAGYSKIPELSEESQADKLARFRIEFLAIMKNRGAEK